MSNLQACCRTGSWWCIFKNSFRPVVRLRSWWGFLNEMHTRTRAPIIHTILFLRSPIDTVPCIKETIQRRENFSAVFNDATKENNVKRKKLKMMKRTMCLVLCDPQSIADLSSNKYLSLHIQLTGKANHYTIFYHQIKQINGKKKP